MDKNSSWLPTKTHRSREAPVIIPTMAKDRRIDEDIALRAVVMSTVEQTGPGFYRALVSSLAQALDTAGAWVTEYDPSRDTLRALAFCMDGIFVDDFEYPIGGTACETAVREKRLVHIPERVFDLYPGEPEPPFDKVVSYLGVPILDEHGGVLGHLAVVDSRPMPDEKRLVALFQIFAARVSAEVRRLRLEADVREREEELRRLFNSAMDAIVQMDHDLCVTMMNPAAERLFHQTVDRVGGQGIDRLLRAERRRGPWPSMPASSIGASAARATSSSPGFFRRSRRDGTPFLAEGTLSRSESSRPVLFHA